MKQYRKIINKLIDRENTHLTMKGAYITDLCEATKIALEEVLAIADRKKKR